MENSRRTTVFAYEFSYGDYSFERAYCCARNELFCGWFFGSLLPDSGLGVVLGAVWIVHLDRACSQLAVCLE